MTDVSALPESTVDATIAGDRDERSIFVVVGMHRSGTSLCSHALMSLGVDMADDVGSYSGNPYGHFERWDIVAHQDEILGLFDRAYYSRFHDFPLPPEWWTDPRVEPIKERLKASLAAVMTRSSVFGFKDPRTARLLPVWNQIFAELALRPRFVVCLRDPAHVAASLRARDGLDPAIGELRALNYMVDALRHTRGAERCFVRYDDWMSDLMFNATKLLNFVGPAAAIEAANLEPAIKAIVRPEENHAVGIETEAREPLVHEFFSLVSRFAETEGADAALDAEIESFTSGYLAFRQAHSPLFADIVHSQATLEAALAESQRRAETLGVSLGGAEKQRGYLTEAYMAASQQVGALERALHAEQAIAAQLRNDLSAAQARVESAEQALAEQVSRIDALTAAFHNVVAQRDQVLEAHKVASEQLSEAQQELEAEREIGRRLRESLSAAGGVTPAASSP
jgi:hypothetical protein